MMRFLADENFNNQIIRGVLRRVPSVKFIRVQDTDLMGQPDPEVLEYALEQDLVLISHDVNTIRGFYYQRVASNEPVPTVFLVHGEKPIGDVIDALVLILLATDASEWTGQLHYIPL